MQAFIKGRRDFITKAHGFILNYNIKRSIYDTVSTVTISNINPSVETGDFIFLDGLDFIGIITDISTSGTAAELSVVQQASILDRQLIYKPQTYTYLESYLQDLINANYVNCADEFYSYPYLTVEALTHTEAQAAPDTEDDNTYTIKSYAAKLRRLYNIFLTWGIKRQQLTLTISMHIKIVNKVDFGNPNYLLTEQNFSNKTVSKITSLCEENDQVKDWVLLADGNIVNDAPIENRIAGEWIVLTVSEAAEVENAVRNEFYANEYSHKIGFKVKKNLGFKLYDRLQIRLDNKLFYSYVTEVEEENGSEYVKISCGELQTTYPFLTAD